MAPRQMTGPLAVALILGCASFLQVISCRAQKKRLTSPRPVAHFAFDGTIAGLDSGQGARQFTFAKGLDKDALSLKAEASAVALSADGFQSTASRDFSVAFWVRTTMDSEHSAVFLSKKNFVDKSLASQKNPGWVFYASGGTWAWNLGSGQLRITHERDNGKTMPINDGKWHQLAMTYDHNKSEVRLFFDGMNRAIYRLSDSTGFNFANNEPLMVGWDRDQVNPRATLSMIDLGRRKLQALLDAFNEFGLQKIRPDEFESLIVDPAGLLRDKIEEMKALHGGDSTAFHSLLQSTDLSKVPKVRTELMDNPYTVHQVRDFMEVAPLLKIYLLADDRIQVDEKVAAGYAASNMLRSPECDVDNLSLWDQVLSGEDILASYSEYFKTPITRQPAERTALKAAIWNIHHGGIHNTVADDGWDSRMRIVEMLRKENADIIMLQETYSNGDFIAAELGYYFATAMDIDYLNQGTNISVLSRYPIRDVYVPRGASFMNVGCKVAISQTQDIYVMSNWYGMHKFSDVYNFHLPRFHESDSIPVLFGGDFNAVPHTDGGESPASVQMIDAGFTDAYRATYPDVDKYPGASHENNKRIDQLYYKGRGLTNTSTRLIKSWTGGFPSDHFLIMATFELNYRTRHNRPKTESK